LAAATAGYFVATQAGRDNPGRGGDARDRGGTPRERDAENRCARPGRQLAAHASRARTSWPSPPTATTRSTSPNKGRLVGGCGAFKTDGGASVIHLNAPYELGEYSGWTITRQRPHQPPSAPLLTT